MSRRLRDRVFHEGRDTFFFRRLTEPEATKTEEEVAEEEDEKVEKIKDIIKH